MGECYECGGCHPRGDGCYEPDYEGLEELANTGKTEEVENV